MPVTSILSLKTEEGVEIAVTWRHNQVTSKPCHKEKTNTIRGI